LQEAVEDHLEAPAVQVEEVVAPPVVLELLAETLMQVVEVLKVQAEARIHREDLPQDNVALAEALVKEAPTEAAAVVVATMVAAPEAQHKTMEMDGAQVVVEDLHSLLRLLHHL
jgi:hypothetical protein